MSAREAVQAMELIERELEGERVFELCVQVEQYLELLDAAHSHAHARVPRTYFTVLGRIQERRSANACRDRAEVVAAAFWALVPPGDR